MKRTPIYRVRWTRPEWADDHGVSSKLYRRLAAALALAERLERTGAIVTIDAAELVGPWMEVER